MPRKLLTSARPDPREDGTVQVQVTLPVRQHRRETGGHRRSASHTGRWPRIPRITRLMALAIKFQEMVDRGEVRDYADLARLGYVTRARLTQIMNLLLLAPDLQEHLLLSPTTVEERRLRSVAKIVEWQEQRKCFTIALDKRKGKDGLAG
ncbi:MAG: hypothetical protein LAQ69_46250 [Acidobacteriia bacterium]|nr:hypothetical protein [Terriglobia bacterium]